MHKMYGIFDLVAEADEASFHTAFTTFCWHLKEKDLVVDWAFLSRAPHEGYNSAPPSQTHVVEMMFKSEHQAQACWDYVEQNQQPVCDLHHAVNSKVLQPRFALYRAHSPG